MYVLLRTTCDDLDIFCNILHLFYGFFLGLNILNWGFLFSWYLFWRTFRRFFAQLFIEWCFFRRVTQFLSHSYLFFLLKNVFVFILFFFFIRHIKLRSFIMILFVITLLVLVINHDPITHFDILILIFRWPILLEYVGKGSNDLLVGPLSRLTNWICLIWLANLRITFGHILLNI